MYDEDYTAKAAEAVVAAPTLSVEEVEAVIRPKFTEAMTHALAALTLSGLRDEDADVQASEAQGSAQNEANEFEKRPLPHVIGTAAFLEDDFIGLAVPEPLPHGTLCIPLLRFPNQCQHETLDP